MQIYKAHKKQSLSVQRGILLFTVNYGCPGVYRYFLFLHVTRHDYTSNCRRWGLDARCLFKTQRFYRAAWNADAV